jgi:GT2 family glycosyltransferase
MWETCADVIEEAGGNVALEHRVTRVHRDGMRVDDITVADKDGAERRIEGDSFVNSIDLRTLLQIMDPPPPPEILAAAEKLNYRDFLIVTLVLDHPDPFPDNWIYVHSPEVSVGRIQNFRAWSPDMVPDDDTSSIGMEYFCHEGDGLWEMSDEDLIEQAGKELASINLAPEGSVVDGAVIRQPKAYPVYDGDYTENLEIVRNWLGGFENLQTVGRNGMHRYNNQDHSMLTAMLAAENVLGADHDLWEVNVERSYHEEFVKADKDETADKGDDDQDGGATAKELAAYSAVIPARNAEATIHRAVAAALAARPAPHEIIVIDDGSTDRTGEIARELGAKVLTHRGEKPLGPGRARNLGASKAETDFLLFIDSDVVIDPEAPRLLVEELEQDEKIAAAFGSYGAKQACPNLAARYTNLRHHFFHQTGQREAQTFWTGLGVIRGSAFSHLNGFSDLIEKPAMEDVEIGYRMREHGYRIRLVPEATGTHLKNWTVRQLWRDDVFSRALPWSTLLVHDRAPASLNARASEKTKAVCIIATVALLFLAPVLPQAAIGALLPFTAYLVLNAPFFRVLAKRGGLLTLLAGVGLHSAYHLYSTAAYSAAWLRKFLGQPPLTRTADVWIAEALAKNHNSPKP